MSALTPATLRRRNDLWKRLRSLPPYSPEFEATLLDLSALTGWDRARILAGLGWTPAEQAAAEASA
ncbi:hypothetical protein ACINK0_06045 [Deinococcus sp. VB343]|uniref:hypothetical protein n=1 Tax=Deinococcus sp. VB343 TaxID=3385567 RepID=UPI0039C960EC